MLLAGRLWIDYGTAILPGIRFCGMSIVGESVVTEILLGLFSIYSKEEYGKQLMASVCSEKPRLCWLTRNLARIPVAAVFQSSIMPGTNLPYLPIDFSAFQSFIPAITLLPSSIGDNYFSCMTMVG